MNYLKTSVISLFLRMILSLLLTFQTFYGMEIDPTDGQNSTEGEITLNLEEIPAKNPTLLCMWRSAQMYDHLGNLYNENHSPTPKENYGIFAFFTELIADVNKDGEKIVPSLDLYKSALYFVGKESHKSKKAALFLNEFIPNAIKDNDTITYREIYQCALKGALEEAKSRKTEYEKEQPISWWHIFWYPHIFYYQKDAIKNHANFYLDQLQEAYTAICKNSSTID